ncbi:putative manganese efflux pump MntP [termite gut metagenome]|uniref:Putative manganese efflux pump MntP n=1 Tax=termite gut metagenome TaxID=433724 RepID=A0A5J4PZ77_9ZZZZ
MSNVEIWLLALSLSMDCFAVSVESGLILKKVLWKPILVISATFGLFQGMMPVIGWASAGTFSRFINDIDHWVAFLILLFLGGRMIWESFKGREESKSFHFTSLKVVVTMAVATSIDALAVGISFAFWDMKQFFDILYPVCAIGLVSFVMSLGGHFLGIFCAHKVQKIPVEFLGGLILIIIGVKILVGGLLLES